METSERKLTVEECRSILNKNGIEYTNEEIIQIRDFLYLMAEITSNNFQRMKDQEQVISINKNVKEDENESISLCESKYRRAS